MVVTLGDTTVQGGHMRISAKSVSSMSGVLVGACVLTSCAMTSAPAGEDPRRTLSRVVPEKVEIDPSQVQDAVPEESIVSLEDQALQDDVRLLTESLNGHSSLVSVSPDTSRGSVTVYWYGTDTTIVDRATEKVTSFVEVTAALYSPAELRTAATYLITEDVGFQVGSVGAKLDGSGVQVSVHQPPDDTPIEEIAHHLAGLVNLPVDVDFNVPVVIPG